MMSRSLGVTLYAIVLGLSLICTACSPLGGRFPTPESLPDTIDTVAGEALLAGTAWEPIPLQLRTGADIRSLDIVENTLYVVDSTSTAHAINLATGTHRWVLKLDRMPTRPPVVDSGYVAFVARNHVTVATRSSGTVVLQRALEFTPSSAVALTIDSLYAGAWGNGTRVRSVSLGDGWNGWLYRSDAAITSAPLAVGSGADQFLYFATQGGEVFALSPDPASGSPPDQVVWSTRTLGSNSADLVTDGDTIFVASQDHALYAMNRISGAIEWKWLDGQVPLHQAPTLVGDTLYQPFEGVIVALDKETGAERWRYAGAEGYLTRVGQRDYVKLHGSSVAILDSETGEELGRVASPLFDTLVANGAGGALVFSDGRNIVALK